MPPAKKHSFGDQLALSLHAGLIIFLNSCLCSFHLNIFIYGDKTYISVVSWELQIL